MPIEFASRNSTFFLLCDLTSKTEKRKKRCFFLGNRKFWRYCHQRWSRGQKARGQGPGHKKNQRPRPRTAFPRTDTLEAKDRNARGQGQGHKRKCSPKKKKKKSSQKFFRQSPQKNVFQKIFQAIHKILTIQKIVLSSNRGQANFQGLEASWPRTSKCVLEDSTSDCLSLRYNLRCL